MTTNLARRIAQVRANPRALCKHIRSTLGLSQERLARLCDVAMMTVSRWECHRQKPTSAHAVTVLIRLAHQTGYILPKPVRKLPPRDLKRVALSPIPRERRQQLFEMQSQAQWEMEQEFEERRRGDE